ncbi:MAG: PKD domain-containing protein, partial [Bacteroidia bacterium]
MIGNDASEKFEGANEVYINNWFGIPGYVKFESAIENSTEEFVASLPQKLKLGDGIKFIKYREDADDIGLVHFRYYQYYKNLPVVGSMLIVHTRNGKIESFNGEYYPLSTIHTETILDAEACLNKILDSKNIYAWNVQAEQNFLKEIKNDPNATWFPKGELVICPVNGELNNPTFKLAWKFDIYSMTPHERENIYVDARDGNKIHSQKILCEVDVNGKAIAKYAGVQTIKVDSLGATSFRMRETGRGGGVDTYDNTSGTDFTDNNNVWDSTTSKRQMVAADVHFGSEKTFDYYLNFHNRKSFDNNNAKMIGILQGNFVNAFWNGTYSAYGYGSGTWGPVTGIDVVGHEYTHGVTQKSSNLVYSGEPGSLNESFSDIFGKLVEWYGLPSKFKWYLGHYGAGPNKAFRNMANPNEFGCPDTYGGKFWNAGDIVHYNSSVQNFWFFLLATGGTGTNDSNHKYYVDSIGMEKAAKVAYRNNAFYLTTNSKFNDARFYGIKSAQDIFGDCTKEIEAVTNAWYAVGVGKGYTSPAGKPKGTTIDPYNKRYCSTDSFISLNFKNPYSYTAIKYRWTFGDGDSSTVQNPTHVFKKYGVYKTILRTEYCFKYYYDTSIITLSQKPIIDFLINNDTQCLDKNKYKFTSLAYSKLKRKIILNWEANPFSLSGKDSIISFTFDVPATYNIKLTATDDRGCFNEITKQVEVIPSTQFNFTFKNSCPGQTVNFISSNLPDTSQVKYTLQWDLDEGTTAKTEKVSKIFKNTGVYKISLALLSANISCSDTVSKMLTVYKMPYSDFTYDSICPGIETMFRKVKTNDSLNYFEWDFGIYKPSDKDSVKTSFDYPGQYTVSLRSIGKKCISSISKQVYVGPNPIALFTGHDVCEGEKQIFSNKSSVSAGVIKMYEWNFGDVTSSTLFEPEKLYSKYGSYTVKLNVMDQRGCKNSSSMNLKVNPNPLASFTVSDICFGQNFHAINTSTDPYGSVLSNQWWIDNLDNGKTKDLLLNSILTGTYQLKLEVKNDKGCLAQFSKMASVKPIPNPSFLNFSALYCINENPNLQPFSTGGSWFMNNLP